MQNKTIELTERAIGLKRYSTLQLINNSHVNFQWEIGKYFIGMNKQDDEQFIASESLNLQEKWGCIFSVENIKKSIVFATLFTDSIRAGVLAATMTWKYLKILLLLNDAELIMNFSKKCTDENLSIAELNKLVEEVLLEGHDSYAAKGKGRKGSSEKLYQIQTHEHGRDGDLSFLSTDILIMDGQSALASDGIINNLFPDRDLEAFLKMDILQNPGT